MNDVLRGKEIVRGSLGNSPHKFVWYNRGPAEFARLVKGKTVGMAKARGRWMFVDVVPGFVLVLGECGGKLLFHPPGKGLPEKCHLSLEFDDGSGFSVMTSMWGAMQLYEAGKELSGKYVKDMRVTPDDKRFTFAYFADLIDSLPAKPIRSVKGLLTQDQLIPGLGNSIAQDIMFLAGLNPKYPISELTGVERRKLYNAIVRAVREVTKKGGRADEFDLFGKPGGYKRIMDKGAAGRPCPRCGAEVKKIQYLGGACYFCPGCQE
jgi:formamidopyrimidine-DNA glycosylase